MDATNGSASNDGATKGMKIVVGIDFYTAGSGALERALALANASPRSEVHAVTVIDTDSLRPEEIPSDALPRLERLAEETLAKLASKAPVLNIARVVVHLLHGSPSHAIVWLAAYLDADLIVVGSHGRRAVPRFLLGSVAERVLRSAGCPVLVERTKHHDPAWKMPEIEPPCPACVARRAETNGEELWCERHASHHMKMHVYSDTNDRVVEGFQPWGFAG